MALPDSAACHRFYAATLLGLRSLDEREGTSRRFGTDADARWGSFAGHLRLAHRIDLLIRDAAVKWGPAFSPARVFDLTGLAADEPFGPDWEPMEEADACRLWREAEATGGLPEAARLLGVETAHAAVPDLAPSTLLCVAGGAAIRAVGEEFGRRSDLSWAKQVLVVAKKPEHRQLAGLVAPLIRAQGSTRLVTPGEDVAPTLKAAGFAHLQHAVVSEDADAASARFAGRAAGSA